MGTGRNLPLWHLEHKLLVWGDLHGRRDRNGSKFRSVQERETAAGRVQLTPRNRRDTSWAPPRLPRPSSRTSLPELETSHVHTHTLHHVAMECNQLDVYVIITVVTLETHK